MKKSLLILAAFVLSALGSKAQITITTADIAAPVKVIYQANDTLLTSSAIVGSFGISQTWNMTSLANHTTDTMTFMSASWLPNANFPTSNLIIKQGWQNNYIYATNSASSFTIEGLSGTADFGAGPMTINQVNTPSEILMNFPGTYLSSFTNNYVNNTNIYLGYDPGFGFVIDSVRLHSHVKKTSLVDAWGTLTTPLGTFNVLRVEETVVRHDTTDAQIPAFGGWIYDVDDTADSTTGYSWWANGVGFPLVSIKLDSLSNVKQTQWLLALPSVGINEYTNATSVIVYPNPAQNEITFALETSKVASIQVFDVAGRMIDTYTVSGAIASINTSAFANGIYSYALIGNDKAILNRGKFTVAK